MGWFDKHCEKCRIKVDKNTAPKHFGNYFCSKEHAAQYTKELEKNKKKSGGCCG